MTLQEIRLLAVLGHVAIALSAIVVALVVVSIARVVQKLRIARALPSLRGDARAGAGHLIDHRPATSSGRGAPLSGRLGC